MALVIQDYGHGKQRDPGATYRNRTESDDVLRLGKKVTTILRNNGVKVIETRKGNEFVSLIERSRISNRNNADIFVSYHRNAFNGKAKGAETFTYPRSSARSVRLAKAIQRTLVGVGFVDRGHKTKNLSVLRETKAPAVLIETGFIDNPGDNKIFDNNLDKIADGIARDILNELGIKYKPNNAKPSNSSTNNKLYRVRKSWKDASSQKGAFENLSYAKTEAKKHKGFKVYDWNGKQVYPKIASKKPRLTVDGYWGPATTRELQRQLGTTVDGVISGQYPNSTTKAIPSVSFRGRYGSNAIRALQRKIGVKADGYIGPNTVRALQKYLGTYQDGVISRPSNMVKELQRQLNNNSF